MQLAPEVAKGLGLKEEIKVGSAVMLVYLGLTFGDLSSGIISQILKNRKKTIRLFLLVSVCFISIHLNSYGISLLGLYISYVFLGFGAGYWVSLITLSAEQFGTNLRATVATTIPNFARGAVVPISIFYQWILNNFTNNNVIHSAIYTGFLCLGLAFVATFFIKDTFSNNLDFIE